MAIQSNADLHLLNGLLLVTSVFWPPFTAFNFAFINIYFYTVPPYFLYRPLSRLPWGLLLNTWLTFLLLYILLTWPIQFNRLFLTNESISKSPNRCINSLLYGFHSQIYDSKSKFSLTLGYGASNVKMVAELVNCN